MSGIEVWIWLLLILVASTGMSFLSGRLFIYEIESKLIKSISILVSIIVNVLISLSVAYGVEAHFPNINSIVPKVIFLASLVLLEIAYGVGVHKAIVSKNHEEGGREG